MPYTLNGYIPCDPLGGVLMQGSLATFLAHAKTQPAHYGRHGLETFALTFHRNVEVKNAKGLWVPTAFTSWEPYNKLLDEQIKEPDDER